MLGCYLAIVLGAALNWLPWPTLIALLTLPLAWNAVQGARKHYAEPQELLPSNAATIQVHLVTGILLTVGIVLSTLFQRLVRA
jgi:1,4-dihydroxy-2-naphthoate octaprenyltransferase